MSPIRIGIIAFLMTCVSSYAVFSEEYQPAVLAVFDVQVKGIRIGPVTVENIGDYLSTILAGSKQYAVVPRSQIRASLFQEKSNSYRECFDESCQIQLGRELAAQKFLATMIARVGNKCIVNMIVFDLAKATSDLASSSDGGCSEDLIFDSVKLAANQLLQLFAGSGQSCSSCSINAFIDRWMQICHSTIAARAKDVLLRNAYSEAVKAGICN